MPKAPAPKPGDEKLPPLAGKIPLTAWVQAWLKQEAWQFAKDKYSEIENDLKYRNPRPFEDLINDAITQYLFKNKR